MVTTPGGTYAVTDSFAGLITFYDKYGVKQPLEIAVPPAPGLARRVDWFAGQPFYWAGVSFHHAGLDTVLAASVEVGGNPVSRPEHVSDMATSL